MNKIKITSSVLRKRNKPSLSGRFLGFAAIGEYTYSDKVWADSYYWYSIAENTWVAGVSDCLEEIKDTWTKPESVEKNTKEDQIYVGKVLLRIRADHSTSSNSKGYCDKNSYYNVEEIYEGSNYTWYKIGTDAWVAGVEEVEFYEAEGEWAAPQPVAGELNKDQLWVGNVVLNIRLGPNTIYERKATCNSNSFYDVLAIEEQDDYTWYQLGINAWVAGVEEVEYIPAGQPKNCEEIIEKLELLQGNLNNAIKTVENKKCVEFYDELLEKTVELNDFISDNFNPIDYDYEDNNEYDEIDLIYTTDIHGYWKGYEESTRVQTNFSINDLTTLKNNLKKQGIPSLLVNCGDIIHGSSAANSNYGADVVEAFNDIDMFASVFGNHEFRYNDEGAYFQKRMKALESTTACNLLYKDTGELVFKPYRTARFGSKTIGIIGVGFPGFDGGRGNTDEYTILDGTDCCKQIQKYVDELKELGINYIFCAVHLGAGTDARAGGNISVPIIAENTYGIDAILPGHSHAMAEQYVLQNSKGQNVIVAAQPRCDLMYISRVRINKDGITSELLDTI